MCHALLCHSSLAISPRCPQAHELKILLARGARQPPTPHPPPCAATQNVPAKLRQNETPGITLHLHVIRKTAATPCGLFPYEYI